MKTTAIKSAAPYSSFPPLQKKTNPIRQMTALPHMSPVTFTRPPSHRCLRASCLFNGNSAFALFVPHIENESFQQQTWILGQKKAQRAVNASDTFFMLLSTPMNSLRLPSFLTPAERGSEGGISSADRTADGRTEDAATASRRTESRSREVARRRTAGRRAR